jgi:hypothetical protein
MTTDQLISIGFSILVLIPAVIYLVNGFRANRHGVFYGKGGAISRTANPTEFKWAVWGRIISGFILLTVSIALAYFLGHSSRPNP